MNNLPPGVTDRMIEEQQETPRYTIDRLKSNWLNDPHWDIENTEGFENYYIELKAFRIGCELDWKQSSNNLAENTAKLMDCSLEVAKYILYLESKISEFECFMAEFGY
jgi:hypothetical protein